MDAEGLLLVGRVSGDLWGIVIFMEGGGKEMLKTIRSAVSYGEINNGRVKNLEIEEPCFGSLRWCGRNYQVDLPRIWDLRGTKRNRIDAALNVEAVPKAWLIREGIG